MSQGVPATLRPDATERRLVLVGRLVTVLMVVLGILWVPARGGLWTRDYFAACSGDNPPAALESVHMRAQNRRGHECYHCKQWIPKGVEHDCWTTTEEALTRDLPEDLREAWQRIRESAGGFGDQRIYASLNSIMFARKVCYCFVRPRPKRLEVVFFLGRRVRSPIIRRIEPASKVKFAHFVHIVHRDEVEPPLTGWLKEAYDVSPELSAKPAPKRKARRAKKR